MEIMVILRLGKTKKNLFRLELEAWCVTFMEKGEIPWHCNMESGAFGATFKKELN